MKDSQFFGWSRDDAAPLTDCATPRRETWLSKRMQMTDWQSDRERKRADLEEYKSDIFRDALKVRHDLWHTADYPVDDCEFCKGDE